MNLTDAADRNQLLENVATTYRHNSKQDNIIRELCVREFSPWLKPGSSGLEIGCSDGYMTEMLSGRLRKLHVVEATRHFIDIARARNLKNVVFTQSLFEQCAFEEKYDYVFLTWILTHLSDVQLVLRRAQSLLLPGGILFVTVPNARVLSRQLALHMGLIGDLFSMSNNDLSHGHLRAYDRQKLDAEISASGMLTISRGGLMLKPLADFQMDDLYKSDILGPSHVEGLYKLGHQYPDLASAIYSICKVQE